MAYDLRVPCICMVIALLNNSSLYGAWVIPCKWPCPREYLPQSVVSERKFVSRLSYPIHSPPFCLIPPGLPSFITIGIGSRKCMHAPQGVGVQAPDTVAIICINCDPGTWPWFDYRTQLTGLHWIGTGSGKKGSNEHGRWPVGWRLRLPTR